MISIIIITKQEEKYLSKLLKSIKNQTYKGYEIIVSDAKSTDKTRKIAKSYGCRIVEGGMPSVGRNNGAKIAKGEILLFLDSDVILHKNFLKLNIEEFNKRNLGTACPWVVPLSKKISDRIIYFLYNFWSRLMQFSVPCVSGFCIFCKKRIFDKSGGFDEKISILEDLDFVKSTLKHGKFRILKSSPIQVSVRKFEKEGRIRMTLKYVYMGIYFILFGKKETSIVEYTFQGDVKVEKGKKI
jgi:glycosyltransferase involved in cell wall biosynthesis